MQSEAREFSRHCHRPNSEAAPVHARKHVFTPSLRAENEAFEQICHASFTLVTVATIPTVLQHSIGNYFGYLSLSLYRFRNIFVINELPAHAFQGENPTRVVTKSLQLFLLKPGPHPCLGKIDRSRRSDRFHQSDRCRHCAPDPGDRFYLQADQQAVGQDP